MRRTGIFFTYFQGERLRDFPQALGELLSRENVLYYDAFYDRTDGLFFLQPASEEALLKVHSPQMVQQVKATGDYLAAAYSAGGTVHAAREVFAGRIDNAFVFTSFGDHHAGRDFFGGLCYFNGAALAVAALRERGWRRFLIVDTDAHHADGTRDIFLKDEEVLHLCFCHQDYRDDRHNVDVRVGHGLSDAQLLALVRREVGRAREFRPQAMFWEFGYDATRGEYGDKGLSPQVHVELAGLFREVAEEVCGGRLVVTLCGGSGRGIANYAIPRIIARLAG